MASVSGCDGCMAKDKVSVSSRSTRIERTTVWHDMYVDQSHWACSSSTNEGGRERVMKSTHILASWRSDTPCRDLQHCSIRAPVRLSKRIPSDRTTKRLVWTSCPLSRYQWFRLSCKDRRAKLMGREAREPDRDIRCCRRQLECRDVCGNLVS